MQRPLLVSLLLAAPFAAELSAPADELAFAPAEGARLRRTFDIVLDLELSEVSFVVNGEEQDIELPEVTINDHERIVVLDEIAGSEEGRPTKLRRTFEEVTNDTVTESPDGSEESVRVSELAEATIVFTWDADEDDFVVVDENEELDEETLEGLVEDMDLRGFLPDGEVAEDESWEPEIEAYRAIMWPGGFMRYRDEGEDEPDEENAEINTQIYESLAGEISATYKGTRDEDGVQLGVIELVIECTGEALLEGESEDGSATINRPFSMVRTVEGELLWNLTSGRLESCSLTGDDEVTFGTDVEAESPDGEFTLEQAQTFSGTVTHEITFEVAE